MPGKLYVVGTSLGNMGDISPRAVQTLSGVDFIAAEDTRVTMELLSFFGIAKPMVSCHEHNVGGGAREVRGRIAAGESCALVTDAGMPCISDPGEGLVKLCVEMGVEVCVVPGPTAVTTALAISGMSVGRFAFEGFLTVKKAGRFARLEEVKNDPRTLVFYEAPQKLLYTLSDMLAVFGERNVVLARDLTKPQEEVIRTTLSNAVEKYKAEPPRGEYVVIIGGASSAVP